MHPAFNTPGLLEWFAANGKDYPWGTTPTPYKVWISEIMLQQTVITTVIPYYKNWLRTFPDVFTLAAAGEKEVLRLWEGLGYYSRARNIHKAAGIIVKEYRGKLPEDEDLLEKLPGIGRYTSRAILSIAFGHCLPVLDANVLRIGQRLLGQEQATPEFKKQLNDLLREAIPPGAPGRFNEALMQLGQQVCRQVPLCPLCPLAEGCRACAAGNQESIPARKKRNLTIKQTEICILHHRNSFFLTTTPSGLFSGLWRFPGYSIEHKPKGIGKILKLASRTAALPPRDHNYTRYKDSLKPFFYELPSLPERLPWEGRWFSRKQMTNLPMPSVYRKILPELDTIVAESSSSGTEQAP